MKKKSSSKSKTTSHEEQQEADGLSGALRFRSSTTSLVMLTWLVSLCSVVTLTGICMSLTQPHSMQILSMMTSVETEVGRDDEMVMMSTPSVEVEERDVQQTPFLCSITRVHNAYTKYQSFIRHQLREGFDRVLILDDRNEPSLTAEDPRVEIMRVDLTRTINQLKSEGKRFQSKNKANHSFIRSIIDERLINCTWVANVDVDEFITTRRNEERTTRDEMLLSFNDFDVVHVPWIFYGNPLDPDVRIEGDITQEVLWRWNHSKHHDSSLGRTRDRYRRIGMCASLSCMNSETNTHSYVLFLLFAVQRGLTLG